MLDNGCPLDVISHILGHDSLDVTLRPGLYSADDDDLPLRSSACKAEPVGTGGPVAVTPETGEGVPSRTGAFSFVPGRARTPGSLLYQFWEGCLAEGSC